MSSFNFIQVTVILNLITSSFCWQFFTALSDFTLTNSLKDPEVVHSEYIFGDCQEETKVFYTHIYLEHMDVMGKLIVRGWLDLFRIPTCIKLTAISYEENTFRNTAYNFQMCVPRITYCHSKQRFKYYYYEWYIPVDLVGAMNWHIYFYGPPSPAW